MSECEKPLRTVLSAKNIFYTVNCFCPPKFCNDGFLLVQNTAVN